MISVCICTYNGEKFIREQLMSIMNQTLKADEVIIYDDGSSDATVEIVKYFIKENKLADTWKLYYNNGNKGYPHSFYHAMKLCSGDIVFLGDQDDVWTADKLDIMVSVMDEHKQVKLLASKWGMIDTQGQELKSALKVQRKNKEELEAVTFEQVLYRYEWPGMSMCYRKGFGQEFLGIIKTRELAHDMALALTAAEQDAFFVCSQVCQYHRRHESNTAREEHRLHKLLNKERKVEEIREYLAMLQKVVQSGCVRNGENALRVEKKREIMQTRLRNLESGKRSAVWKQYWGNREEIRVETVICDLIICGRKGQYNEGVIKKCDKEEGK